ncbi:MAG: hypothetical protein ACRC1F_01820 [Metamycoplasmataceae bacterium]
MNTKKLLLGLGASLLAILPITAVISCSSDSSTPVSVKPEAEKFDKTVVTTAVGFISAEEAVKEIQSGKNAQERLDALKSFASVPTLSEGFEFEVLSAKINPGTNTTIDVLIKVFEKGNKENFEEVTYRVEGFVAPNTDLDTEAAKFNVSVVTKKPNLNSNEAIKTINDATTPEESLAALKELADVPTLEQGFEFAVIEARISSTNTVIDVSILVSRTIVTEAKYVNFKVTGFQPGFNVSTEAAKFPEYQSTRINGVNFKSIHANLTINLAPTPGDKLAALRFFAPTIPVLENGISFEILSSSVNKQNSRTIDVSIKVFEISNPANNETIIMQVGDFFFLNRAEVELLKFSDPVNTLNSNMTVAEAVQSITSAPDSDAKTAALELIAPINDLADGFTYRVESAEAAPGNLNEIRVRVVVTELQGPWDFETIFIVRGFK